MTAKIDIAVHIYPSLYDVDNLFIPKEEYIKNVGEIRWENEFDFDIPRMEKYLICFNKAVYDMTSAYPSARFELFVPCGIFSRPIKSRWKETMYKKYPYRSSVKRYFGVEGKNERLESFFSNARLVVLETDDYYASWHQIAITSANAELCVELMAYSKWHLCIGTLTTNYVNYENLLSDISSQLSSSEYVSFEQAFYLMTKYVASNPSSCYITLDGEFDDPDTSAAVYSFKDNIDSCWNVIKHKAEQ